MGVDQWHDVRWFDSDMRDPALKTPNELACHNAMLSVHGLDCIPRLREGGRRDLIDDEVMKYRVYVEWCKYGDLDSLMQRFEREERPIPEPFIWSVAEFLLECAIAMAEGTTSEMRDEEWQEIVHR